MKSLMGVSDDVALLPRVLAHYYLAAPLIEASLSGAPIVYRNYPAGIDKEGAFHVTSVQLTAAKLLWLIHAKYAMEFYTWAPLADDEERLRFARILLQAPSGVTFERVKLAALAMRALLFHDANLEAVPLLDGGAGMALWIPLADSPRAQPLREWLHQLAHRAATLHPDLISTEYNTHKDGRVHVHVSSNAAGHYSAVPYSLRAQGLTICTPIRWEELGGFTAASALRAEDLPARLHEHGDLFAKEVGLIEKQTFAAARVVPTRTTPEPRGHIITAAVEILGDGKARTADELLAEALKRKLVPPETTRKYVYSALIEYIARQLGRGRKPPVVQDAQRRFRVNEPPDDWPDLVPLPQWPAGADATALAARLEATGTGADPAAFEAAACDVFGHLGFLTQHLGGHGQPDGIADAILGRCGYRVMLECKTAKKIVPRPDVAEAAKFRDDFKADRCALIGPMFSDETELLAELETHLVTAITVPDLQTLLHLSADPLEVARVLVPGYASDVIADVLWERGHGAAKRVGTVATLIAREGWKAQLTAAEEGGARDAPKLTVDAAMLVVQEALRTAGSTQACTLEEVEYAFAWLSSPNVGIAERYEDGLIVRRRGNIPAMRVV
jgi:DNA primase